MRFPRIKAEGQSFYHCVSRVVGRQFIFQTAGHGSPEAERFVLLMRRLEAFSGVRVLTYALMSNHFHLLCEVPQAQELSEVELLERIQAGYGPARRQALGSQSLRLRNSSSVHNGFAARYRRLPRSFLTRTNFRCDISGNLVLSKFLILVQFLVLFQSGKCLSVIGEQNQKFRPNFQRVSSALNDGS